MLSQQLERLNVRQLSSNTLAVIKSCDVSSQGIKIVQGTVDAAKCK